MINFGSLALAVGFAVVMLTNAQQPAVISDWTKLADGFKSAWQGSNAPTDFQSTFASDKIYVIRQSRNDTPGGMVSSLDVRLRTWSHQEYTLNINNLRFIVFTLKSSPLMLTYDVQRDESIRFFNMYYWNDRAARWVSVPLDIDRQVSAANARSPIYVSVPDQDGSLAYINVRGPQDPQNVTSPIIFSLNVEDRGASLRVAAKIPGGGDTRGVVFTAVKDQSTFVAFACGDYEVSFFNIGTLWRVNDLTEIDRRNGTQHRQDIDNVLLDPAVRNDRIFQVKNYVIFFALRVVKGGTADWGWTYDMVRGEWKSQNIIVVRNQLVVDQKNAKVYDIDWDQVYVASFNVEWVI